MAVERTEQLKAVLWWIDPVQGLIVAFLALALQWALLSVVQEPNAVQVQQVRADRYATVVAAQSSRHVHGNPKRNGSLAGRRL
jgi:hypothetical protein